MAIKGHKVFISGQWNWKILCVEVKQSVKARVLQFALDRMILMQLLTLNLFPQASVMQSIYVKVVKRVSKTRGKMSFFSKSSIIQARFADSDLFSDEEEEPESNQNQI